MPALAVRVYTIGHSTRALDELVGLLRAHAIRRLTDVRSVPRSRRHPQFNREALPEPLAGAGIEYVHAPALGGLRKPRPDSRNTAWQVEGFRGYADYMETREFETGLDALIADAARMPTAVMCAEAVPWRCHRSLIADALVARGVEVLHVVGVDAPAPHRLTPFAHLADGRVTYPGPVQHRLPLAP
jgi:uncharacterized protein (DUF488 family)